MPSSEKHFPHEQGQSSVGEAVAGIPDGASLAVGGFGLSGVPEVIVRALYEQGATGLEVVSDNCGVDGRGLGVLLRPVASRVCQRVIGAVSTSSTGPPAIPSPREAKVAAYATTRAARSPSDGPEEPPRETAGTIQRR